jgi:4-amino-4-deoxy-L-arabinose transferase-like glycosyltransferase
VTELAETTEISKFAVSPTLETEASGAALRERDIWPMLYRLLPLLWLPACCGFIGAYLYAIAGRFAYPYPIEWLEPDTLDIVSRILARLPIYCEPTYAYVASMKAPLYYYVVAAFSLVFGNDLATGRLVSILSTFGVCLIIWNFVWREGRSRLWALFGVALFLASYDVSNDWFDIARLDSFFLLLTITGVFALRFSRGAIGAVIAGLLFAAAFFTKQVVLALIIPTLFLYAFAARRQAILAALTAAAVIVTVMVGMHLATDGWSTFFLIEVPRYVTIDPERMVAFWTADLFPTFFLALLTSIALFVGMWTSDRGSPVFYCGLLCGTILVGWGGRANVAGAANVMMPIYAVLAVTMPLALQATLRRLEGPGRLRRACCVGVHLVALAQLAMLSYDPRDTVPSPSDKTTSERMLARLRSLDGGIYFMGDRYFARLLGRPSVGLDYSLVDVLRDQDSPVAAKLRASIIDALRNGQFAGVVDPAAFVRDSLRLGAPVSLQSMPHDRHNHFTPRFEAYYPIMK